MSIRLLALDLDGTLLREDKTISGDDLTAIDRARDAGIHVTIATGRLASGAFEAARAIGLEGPMVCADGGVIVEAQDGAIVFTQGIARGTADAIFELFARHGAQPYLMTHDAIHGELREDHGTVTLWSDALRTHAQVRTAVCDASHPVTMAVGVGEKDAIREAHQALEREHPEELALIRFEMRAGRVWCVRAQSRHASKGSGLAHLAMLRGLEAAEVAVVGDFYNDVPMFAWAGRSFAMGGTPEEVQRSATDVLEARAHAGGGVAEAIERLLRRE